VGIEGRVDVGVLVTVAVELATGVRGVAVVVGVRGAVGVVVGL